MKNPELPLDSELLQTLMSFWDARVKWLNTVKVGLIVEYDKDTSRAVVQPAIDLLTADGERVEMPLISDVPVMWIGSGGFYTHSKINRGDGVLLLFSDRSLEEFKLTFRRSATDRASMMDLKDAVALAGFGKLRKSALADGFWMQKEDASVYVGITDDGKIRGHAPGGIEFTGGTLTHNGVNVGEDHVHDRTQPANPPAQSGPPAR